MTGLAKHTASVQPTAASLGVLLAESRVMPINLRTIDREQVLDQVVGGFDLDPRNKAQSTGGFTGDPTHGFFNLFGQGASYKAPPFSQFPFSTVRNPTGYAFSVRDWLGSPNMTFRGIGGNPAPSIGGFGAE